MRVSIELDNPVEFFSLACLHVYFLMNIVFPSGSLVSYIFLVPSVVYFGSVFLSGLRFNPEIVVVSFVLFFLIFIAIINSKYGDWSVVKEYFLGSTGGMIHFLFLGFLCASLVHKVCDKMDFYQLFHITFAPISLLLLLFAGLANKAPDIFLDTRIGEYYQRVGNYLILYVVFFYFISLGAGLRRFMCSQNFFWVRIVISWLILSPAFITIILGQLYNSNAATAIGMCLLPLVATHLCSIFYIEHVREGRVYADDFNIRSPFVFWFIALPVVTSSMLLVGLVSVHFFFDVSATRLGGFNTEVHGISSITSRTVLVSGGWEQFIRNPFFGHFKIECEGWDCRYPHSSLFSISTNFGMVGSLVFIVLLYSSLYPPTKLITKLPVDAQDKFAGVDLHYYEFFKTLLLMVVVWFSILFTYFTWSVLWFCIGLRIILSSNDVGK